MFLSMAVASTELDKRKKGINTLSTRDQLVTVDVWRRPSGKGPGTGGVGIGADPPRKYSPQPKGRSPHVSRHPCASGGRRRQRHGHLSSHFRYKGHGCWGKNAERGVHGTLDLTLELKTPVYIGVVTLDHEIKCKSLATTSASIWTSSP